MPISSGGPYEKKNVFHSHGKLSQHVDNSVSKQSNKKFLKIAPALPLLPAVPRPPKLHQRSNTTLGGGGGGVLDIDGSSNGSILLQTNNDGKVQASRSQKERDKNPDRISLDRRGLTTVPILLGETKIRLLSLQHNLISHLDNLHTVGLSRLVFLDIYDNQLDKIAGLDVLPNLRVLLMGKNRIRRMEGLKSLIRLEVLDLHGNQIVQIGGLTMLGELKVLNLAGNQIRILGTYDLQGLHSLQELNLRRNRLKRLLGFSETPQLLKLFLSNNEIQSVEDMGSIIKSLKIREISVDGNPVALGGDCVSFLVSYLPQLQILSHMQITDQVRKAAMAWRLNKESVAVPHTNLGTKTNPVTDNKREEVIYNARTNWELLRSQTAKTFVCRRMSSSLKDVRSDESELENQESLPLSARAVHMPERAELRRAEYSRRRTVSQGGNKTSVAHCHQETLEYFRLPPILTPLVSSPEEASKPNEPPETVSSVEPVADSSLSSLPSDTSSAESDASEEWKAGNSQETPDRSFEQRCIKSASVSSSSSVQRKNTINQNCCHHGQNHRPQTSKPKTKPISNPGKIREQGGDYLVEISGRFLNVYGQGALKFIDRPWNPIKAGDVSTVRFNYVNFNNLAIVLGRLKQRFPNAEHFLFRDTNIQFLGQLNVLADIQGLTSLTIYPEGNPIYQKDWRGYAIYRLSHWGLTTINDLQITDDEVRSAAEEFEGLSDLVLSSLPDSLLQPLLSRLRLDTAQQSARQWLWSADPALRTVVAKEALQWRRGNQTQEDVAWRQKGRVHLNFLLEQACAAVRKLRMLELEWSDILRQLVRDTLVDYSHIDDYMKRCMSEL